MPVLSLPLTTEDIIFDNLSAAALFKYARTCRTIHSQVQSYARRKFHLHRLLAPYFSPLQINHLRQLQASTGMLISGSTAIQFFDRTIYAGSDLDLYVENTSNSCAKIGRWLLEVGYVYVPHPSSGIPSEFIDDLNEIQEDYREVSPPALIEPGPADPGYHGHLIFTFSKKSSHGDRKVQMIVSEGPPLESILNFHSTCVMNVLTHDVAYAFFPRATFEDRIALSLSMREPSRNELALAKYASRGWTIRRHVCHPNTPEFAPRLRYVGDAQCWKIPIFPVFQPDQTVCHHIESNSWRTNFNNGLGLTMSYEVVASPQLRFSYLIHDDDEHLTRCLEREMDLKPVKYEVYKVEDPRTFLDAQLEGIISRCRDHQAWRYL